MRRENQGRMDNGGDRVKTGGGSRPRPYLETWVRLGADRAVALSASCRCCAVQARSSRFSTSWCCSETAQSESKEHTATQARATRRPDLADRWTALCRCVFAWLVARSSLVLRFVKKQVRSKTHCPPRRQFLLTDRVEPLACLVPPPPPRPSSSPNKEIRNTRSTPRNTAHRSSTVPVSAARGDISDRDGRTPTMSARCCDARMRIASLTLSRLPLLVVSLSRFATASSSNIKNPQSEVRFE